MADGSNRVVLIGASVRSLAEAALSDGLVPVCVDMFGDRDLHALLRNHSAGVHVVDCFGQLDAHISHVPESVPVIICGGAEHEFDLLQRLSGKRPVALSTQSVLRQLSDPSSLFPLLVQCGAEVPDWLTEASDLPDGQWLRKSLRSSGGLAVSWAENLTSSDTNRIPAGGEFLQKHLDGPVFSCSWFSAQHHQRPAFAGMALQLSGARAVNAPGFAYAGNIGVANPSPTLIESLRPIAARLATATGLRGFWGMDCVYASGGASVIEVNPRITASHEFHESRNKRSHVSLQLAEFTGGMRHKVEDFDTRPRARFVVYATRTVKISEQQSDCLWNLCSIAAPHRDVWLADIPEVGAVIEATTPFCSLYLRDVGDVNWEQVDETIDQLKRLGCCLTEIKPQWLSKYQGQIATLRQV